MTPTMRNLELSTNRQEAANGIMEDPQDSALACVCVCGGGGVLLHSSDDGVTRELSFWQLKRWDDILAMR